MKSIVSRLHRVAVCLGMFLLLGFAAAGASAQELPIETGRERLQKFLEDVQSLSAGFTQTMFSAEGDSQQSSSGQLLLKRPNRFRWDYQLPFPQLVLADGENLWSVDPDLEQAVVRKLDESLAASPAVLLSGGRNLEEVFSIELVKQDEGLLKVYLAPKEPGSDFQALCLGFNGEQLARLELVDNLDQVTRIDFSDMVLNPVLDDDSFKYVPPEGMDVITQG